MLNFRFLFLILSTTFLFIPSSLFLYLRLYFRIPSNNFKNGYKRLNNLEIYLDNLEHFLSHNLGGGATSPHESVRGGSYNRPPPLVTALERTGRRS